MRSVINDLLCIVSSRGIVGDVYEYEYQSRVMTLMKELIVIESGMRCMFTLQL